MGRWWFLCLAYQSGPLQTSGRWKHELVAIITGQEMFVWTVDESSCVKLSLCVCVCVCVCVDRSRCRFAHSVAGPLQTSVPQTPSSGQELQHQKQVQLVLHVPLHCSYECVWFSVFEDDGTCATHASLNLRVCDFSSVLISGCCCPGRQLAGGRKWVKKSLSGLWDASHPYTNQVVNHWERPE